LQLFAGVSGHAAEDGGHGAVRTILGFVVRLVAADGREEVVVLLLVRILGALGFVPELVVAVDLEGVDVRLALGPLAILGDAVPAAGLMPALGAEDRAVLVL